MESERFAINAVKSLLEQNHLVVQEYDTRNDYGKDLVIDLTEDGEVTGAMIAAQVKGGETFFDRSGARLPARLSDIRLWAESTVPVVGIVARPSAGDLYWVNLSEQCRALMSSYRGSRPPDSHVEQIRVSRRLDASSLRAFIASMKAFAESTSSEAYLRLYDPDDEVRRDGVFTCWTYGRGDARALLLLRRALPALAGRSFLEGMWALNALVGNPDVFGHQGNWIPAEVRREVYPHLVWTPHEIAAMYHQHEILDEDGDGWRRGGTGQLLWHLLNPLGHEEKPPLWEALGVAVSRRQFDSAFRILVGLQWAANVPLDAVDEALAAYPELSGREDVNMLIGHLEDFGGCAVYG